MQRFNRRDFLGLATAGAGALVAGCLDTPAPRQFTHADATIKARPGTPTQTPTAGYTPLGLTTPRDGLLYVPTTYRADTPAPLVVLLHASGSSAQFWEDSGIGALIDDLGIVVVAPDSRFASWDILAVGGYGPDPTFFNVALAHTFLRCNINPARIALGGFSDGGAEALGVGVANGDLFTHVMAYSPGTLFAPWIQGKPKIFVSHGTSDGAFPFDYTKNVIVPRLVDAQYSVNFVEFDGGHAIPAAIARQSFEWFVA